MTMTTTNLIAIFCFLAHQTRAGLFRSQFKRLPDSGTYAHLRDFKPLILNNGPQHDNINAAFEALYHIDELSLSAAPSDVPSKDMTTSLVPSMATDSPSKETVISDPPSLIPTLATSSTPSVTQSVTPSLTPIATASPSFAPSTEQPSRSPTGPPSSLRPSAFPTSQLSTSSPTLLPTNQATTLPTMSPTNPSPTVLPTSRPSLRPTGNPTTFQPCGLSSDDRLAALLAVLDSVANSTSIRDDNTPEGKATTWLLGQDTRLICPGDKCWLQRWALAVIYFSMNGPEWVQCSANTNATDNCGSQAPFRGKSRFLSNTSECDWAGIACLSGCVSEILFENNNVAGRIPTEMGLLTDLFVWGMEQGRVSSTIPSEIGSLTQLIFFDMDFNQLSGSLPSGLLSLSTLTQLDLNNNVLTGNIDGIVGYPNMTFIQLNSNLFTGTVPDAIGTYTQLDVFDIKNTSLSGTMPESICDLRVTAGKNGSLTNLVADCGGPFPEIVCTCCSRCLP